MESAVDRYVGEIRRVSRVLDGVLGKREWLVGGRCSYVDACFLPWYVVVGGMFAEKVKLEEDFPNLHAWLKRIKSRPAIDKATRERDEVMKAN